MAACTREPQAQLDLRSLRSRQSKPTSLPTHYNRLIFAGDVMFARDVRRQILASGDTSLPFRKIAPLMTGADIAFVNLESPFSDEGPYYEGGLVFHAAPETISGLQLAHIAIVSTANNHARDCGSQGVEFTVKWLRQHGIAATGSALDAGAAHSGIVLTRHGIRFGFLGYTYDQSNGNWKDIDTRVALAQKEAMIADVCDLRKRCDVVVVSMHHGIEYMPKPTPPKSTLRMPPLTLAPRWSSAIIRTSCNQLRVITAAKLFIRLAISSSTNISGPLRNTAK